ncbi:putative nucleotidyltransferase with HDIG domain [Caldicoprobacter guelmensis]|uniref:HDIG domain-containing metalloprotein n=1 Tax=Caldicoprobacter guelmensis TaxID=1170224 RepID=UPI00195DECD2|nr:HDIG domain-containing metalloprotein [Caldicoprobacter guelmensis]MBM7582685.1 putative nucleotidyltransferase with HDIG domain [Caldicoprobacter guelmensis]
MTREEALKMVNENVKNANLVKHMLATEAVMRALARRLGEDEEKWGVVGLIHDVDYEKTADAPSQHGLIGAQMLLEAGMGEEEVNAVKAHNEATGFQRVTKLDKALYAADPVTGLIVAAALVKPSKKLADVDTEFVLKKFKEKSFARGASREQIMSCQELGLSLEEFISLAIDAMRAIGGDLGL